MTATNPERGLALVEVENAALENIKSQLEFLIKSEVVPKDYRGKAHEIVTVALYGRELGFSPIVALQSIILIKGNISLKAEAMRSLIWAAGHGLSIDQGEEQTTVTGTRVGPNGTVITVSMSFSVGDAERAGLLVRPTNRQGQEYDGPWQQYPKDMMLARATSRLGRAMFPDVLRGASYTPEEVRSFTPGTAVDVAGNVIDGEIVAPPAIESETVKKAPGPRRQPAPADGDPFPPEPPKDKLAADKAAAIRASVEFLGLTAESVAKRVRKLYGIPNWWDLSEEDLDDLIERLGRTVEAKIAADDAAESEADTPEAETTAGETS